MKAYRSNEGTGIYFYPCRFKMQKKGNPVMWELYKVSMQLCNSSKPGKMQLCTNQTIPKIR